MSTTLPVLLELIANSGSSAILVVVAKPSTTVFIITMHAWWKFFTALNGLKKYWLMRFLLITISAVVLGSIRTSVSASVRHRVVLSSIITRSMTMEFSKRST